MTGPTLWPVVRIERRLAPPPERVFRAWTDPALAARWMAPPEAVVKIAEIDAQSGGRLRIVMAGQGIELEHIGQYIEVDPPRRIVFSWRSPFTDGDSLVTVELAPDGAGTALTLVHERLPIDQVGPHTGGWTTLLGRLDSVLGE